MFFEQILSGRRSIWAFVGTITLVVIGYVLGQFPLAGVAAVYAGANDLSMEELQNAMETMDFSLLGMSENLTLTLLLFTFIFALIGLYIGVRALHKRPLKSIVTGSPHIRWHRILFAFALWVGLTGVAEGFSYFTHPESYVFQFDPGPFITLVLIAFFLLPIQTSTEELFTRGYLMQLFVYLTHRPWIGAVVSSALFAALHGMNPEVDKFGKWTMMSYYFTVGLFLAILTILDDGLELALGVHAATNIFGALYVTYSGAVIQTPAFFQLIDPDVDGMILEFVLAAAFFLWIAQKKYGPWDWGKLIRPLAIGKEESPLASERG